MIYLKVALTPLPLAKAFSKHRHRSDKILRDEIKQSKIAIKSLTETRDKCIKGLEIQNLILKTFEKQL